MYKEVLEEVTRIVPLVYLVGGATRNILMNREVDDWDFTTPYTPDEVENFVRERNPGRSIITIGKRYGTIATKVYLPQSSIFVRVEITTFRSEKYDFLNTGKPEVQYVTNLEEDLMRRDFTMNAIAFRLKNGSIKVIDPFDGQDDIGSKLIRAVGSARQRFKEDPTRMLRAIRFVSTLSFDIDTNTFKRIQSGAVRILSTPKERWVKEIDKLLVGPNVVKGLNYFACSNLLKFMIPELSLQVGYDQMTPYHDFNLWDHTVKTVSAVPAENLDLRWAALLHDIGKPFVAEMKKNNVQKTYVAHELVGAELTNQIGRHLKWSKDRIDYVTDIVAKHLEEDSPLKEYDSSAQKRI